MRNEIIALHGASSEEGAQNYPQCFNLQITGSGSDTPSGILGTQLYSPTDPDILINIYASLSTYVVPGPTPYSGAVSITQSSSSITASGSPVTGTGAATTTTSTTAAGSTTSKTSVTSTPLATKTSTTTTTFHVTTATSPTTTASGSVGSTQTVYGQCGGSGWTGATACNSQATCSSPNPYYSQCLPTGP